MFNKINCLNMFKKVAICYKNMKSYDKTIKIVCMGDSITGGSFNDKSKKPLQTYPYFLQKLIYVPLS
jgi:hypothetical protein